jgi:hypothetical protein
LRNIADSRRDGYSPRRTEKRTLGALAPREKRSLIRASAFIRVKGFPRPGRARFVQILCEAPWTVATARRDWTAARQRASTIFIKTVVLFCGESRRKRDETAGTGDGAIRRGEPRNTTEKVFSLALATIFSLAMAITSATLFRRSAHEDEQNATPNATPTTSKSTSVEIRTVYVTTLPKKGRDPMSEDRMGQQRAVDSGPEGVNSGPEGVNSGPEGVDSRPDDS